MTKLRTLLVGALLALAFIGGVIAQTGLTSRTLSGNEAWQAGEGIGGSSFFLTSGQIRNSQGVATTAVTSGTLSTITNTTGSVIFTAASVSTTVNLPTLPWDGEIMEIVNGSAGAFTQCTVAATDGSTIVNGAVTGALGTGTSAEWRYVLSTNSWYKMR